MIAAISAHRVPFYPEREPPPFLFALRHLVTAFEECFPSDCFRFGHAWYLLRPYLREGKLEELIAERRRLIRLQKEKWRRRIKDHRAQPQLEQGSTLEPLEEGIGCAYLLGNDLKNPFLKEGDSSSVKGGRSVAPEEKLVSSADPPLGGWDCASSKPFIVKPVDEEIFCLNNRKGYGSPLDSRVRPEIPLYRSAQTDCMASELCTLAGLPPITPRTWMEILESPSFYDIEGRTTEKLCSVQEYQPHLTTLLDWLHDHDIALLDPDYVEAICLFIWLIYDTDGHTRNILVCPHGKLIKIDNTLSFPERNARLENALLESPLLGSRPLSVKSKTILHQLPVDAIVERMRDLEMESAIPAFIERVTQLQMLSSREGITLKEVELALIHTLERRSEISSSLVWANSR